MNANTTLLLISALALSLSSPRAAHSQSPAPAAQPDPTSVSAADLEYATRVALAQGVMVLKELAQKDPQGWIIPPIQKVRITGYKDVPRKYRMVEVERPIYEYTDVVVFIPGPSPGEPPIKQIRKQPTKQIGTRKESHVRWDREGPLEMIDKQEIYEYIGDTSWQFSLIGDSAMALEALRAAGVPEDDPVVQRMVDNLFEFLDKFGPPDQTWNLSWLAIALARTEGGLAAEWTEKLASRILDGQITDGTARGLWGPMCMHPRLISVLVSDYIAAEAEFSRRQAKAKEKPTRANQLAANEAEGARNRLKKYADTWTHLALRFATVEFPLVWDDQMSEKVHFMGSTDFFYNQRSADMESTWAALNALAVCAEMKRLPKESLRTSIPPAYGTITKVGVKAKAPPAVDSQLNATTVPPESSMAVLARAANALVALQPEGSGWNECNFHQPVTDFETFGKLLSVPSDPNSFPPLRSPVTAASAAQGVAALDCIARAVGMEKMTKFLPKYMTGALGRTAAQQDLIKTMWPKPTQRPAQFKSDFLHLLLAAARPLQLNSHEVTSGEPTANQLTRMLILAGDLAGGGWGSRFRRTAIPTSTRERYDLLKDLPGQNWKSWHLNAPVDLHKAHVSQWNVTNSEYNTSAGLPFATAAAVHYLASRLSNPGATLQQLCADPTLADQRKGLDALLLSTPKPKQPQIVATKPAATPAKPVVKPTDDTISVIPIKPADTKPKKDESF